MPRMSRTENVKKICACKKWKLCSHAWYLDYQRDGVRYRDNLDKLIGRHVADFIEAKDEARRAIIAKLNGRDPKDLQPSDDPTLRDLLAEYDRERPRRDRYQVPQVLKTPVPSPGGALRPFGEWRVSTVNVDTLKRFRQARPRVAGNRDLTLLRAAFNWAVLQGLVPTTPFRVGGVPTLRLGSETARTRRLQPGEAERLLDAAGSRSGLRDRITAALETGMRRGEILSLQVHQVRFSPRAEIFIPAHIAKQRRDRRIPISSVLRQVLETRKQLLDLFLEFLPVFKFRHTVQDLFQLVAADPAPGGPPQPTGDPGRPASPDLEQPGRGAHFFHQLLGVHLSLLDLALLDAACFRRGEQHALQAAKQVPPPQP